MRVQWLWLLQYKLKRITQFKNTNLKKKTRKNRVGLIVENTFNEYYIKSCYDFKLRHALFFCN